MYKRLLLILFLAVGSYSNAQCPLVYDYLGTLSVSPNFIHCLSSNYSMNIQSNSSWGTYTINWGDGSSNTTGTNYSANALIPHTYAQTTNTFALTLRIPSLTCTLTALVVQEKPVNASIQIPSLGITQACAPKTLTFTNSSTDVSATTSFTWNFGDGTAPVVLTSTNVNQNVLHNYTTGNCQTQVTLQAKNYCSFGNPTIANFNPINIYDKDSVIITPDRTLRCWPDNLFTFTNSTVRNCLAQGNTYQRRERWNFGNYWGLGHDSLVPLAPPNWSTWPPSALRSVAFPTLGIYSIILSDSNLCGIRSATTQVFIVAAPVASVITPTGNICQNSPVTFTNSSSIGGYQYLWNFGTGGGFVNLGNGNKTFTFTTPGTYTVKLVAFVSNGGSACSDTSRSVVNVLASPVANFTMNPSVGCHSIANVSFTNNATNANTYTWTFGNGITSTLQTPPPQNFTVSGTIIPSLVATGSTGCTNTKTQTITIRPNPLPSFTQFTYCVGAPITFTNNSTVTGTNAIISYTWNFGDNSAASTNSAPVHTYTAQNTYTLKLKASTAFCTDSISNTVLINVKPTANFILTPTLGCPPLAVSFSNTSSNATSYVWKFGVSSSPTSAAQNPSLSYSNSTQSLQNYTVTLYANTGAGCNDSIKKSLSVKPRPIAGFTNNSQTGCSPLVTTFSSSSTGASQYTYTYGDGGNSILQNNTHTYTNTTLFTQTVSAQLIVTNTVGCTDTIKKIITIYPEALISFSMLPPSGCSPLIVNFPTVPGVATYTWDHGDGTPTFTTVAAHNYTYSNSTNSLISLQVSLTALTSNGCIGYDTKPVSVFANPIPNFTFSPGGGCTPFSITFSNTSSSNFLNKWDLGNGAVNNLTNTSTTYTNSTGNAQKTFTVKLLVTSNDNCKDSISKTLIVFPQPKADFALDTPACTPKTITFTNTSTSGQTNKWDFGDGSTSSINSPAHLFINTGNSDKSFSVKLKTTSINLCSDSSTINFIVHPKPNFFITSNPDSGCSPLKVLFSKITGVKKYQWSYDNIGFSTGSDIYNTFENKTTNTKNYKIQLIATDVYTCLDTSTKTIKVYPVPTAKYSASPLLVYIPNQEISFTNLSTSAASYTWDFGDKGTSVEYSPSHVYASAGEYLTKLVVTSNKGCKDTFELAEKVLAIEETTIAVPNAFTPNPNGSPGIVFDAKDKSNDIFHPNVKGAEKYTFSIYTRWGELLFETKDTNEGWDGYYKGKICNQDIYIWKITATFFDGKSYKKTGDLILIR